MKNIFDNYENQAKYKIFEKDCFDDRFNIFGWALKKFGNLQL